MTAWQTVRRDLMHGVIFTACASAVLYALRYHQAAVAVAHFSQSINACLLLVMLFETVRARNRRVARLRRFQAIMHGPGTQLEKMAKLQELQAELDARRQ